MAAVLLMSATAAYTAPPSPDVSLLPLEAYAGPGQRIVVPGGGRLNIRCTGRGSPTVILTAGAGEQSLTWRATQVALSATTRVCAWDRPGFGFSDPSADALDTAHLTDSLEAVLASARLRPPYVLVGHSLGSFETLMFAFRHTSQVAGIVLIDPAGPFQDRRLEQAAPATYSLIDHYQRSEVGTLERCIGEMDGRGIRLPAIGKVNGCMAVPEKLYPAALTRTLVRLDSRVAAKKASLSLLTNMFSDDDSRQLMQAWHPLGDMPFIVLTAGEPPAIPASGAAKSQIPAFQKAWSDMHDEMARLSTQGINRPVPKASHYIYQDRPEVVISAIDEVIHVSRAKSRARDEEVFRVSHTHSHFQSHWRRGRPQQ